MLFTPDRELNPPNEPEITETERCANCKEEEPTYILGISTYGLKPDDRVCNFCLNELHQNLTLTN